MDLSLWLLLLHRSVDIRANTRLKGECSLDIPVFGQIRKTVDLIHSEKLDPFSVDMIDPTDLDILLLPVEKMAKAGGLLLCKSKVVWTQISRSWVIQMKFGRSFHWNHSA